MEDHQPVWADNFINKISNSKMGLNLSQGKAVKYYSSDRFAQLIGNGLLVLVDERTKFKNFLNNKEIVTYKNINDEWVEPKDVEKYSGGLKDKDGLKVVSGKIKKGSKTKNITAVIGPAISVKNYEVKKDFYKKFVRKEKTNHKFFKMGKEKLYFNLSSYVKSLILKSGVKKIMIFIQGIGKKIKKMDLVGL